MAWIHDLMSKESREVSDEEIYSLFAELVLDTGLTYYLYDIEWPSRDGCSTVVAWKTVLCSGGVIVVYEIERPYPPRSEDPGCDCCD